MRPWSCDSTPEVADAAPIPSMKTARAWPSERWSIDLYVYNILNVHVNRDLPLLHHVKVSSRPAPVASPKMSSKRVLWRGPPVRGGPGGGFTSFRTDRLSFDSRSSRRWR